MAEEEDQQGQLLGGQVEGPAGPFGPPGHQVDGHVAGVWRPVDGGIEITAFEPLARGTWSGLEAEAGAMISFLADRDPAVYRRYRNWWQSLPGIEQRVLGA